MYFVNILFYLVEASPTHERQITQLKSNLDVLVHLTEGTKPKNHC